MRSLIFTFFALLLISGANAKEYGTYDFKRLLTVSETPSGKKYGFDAAYLDQILNDLSTHAKNYPPKFDTPEDRERAIRDVQRLSGMLDILINTSTPSLELLYRAGYINSMGHNLDIAGASEKANAIFQKLLTLSPSDARGNYRYGTFLAGAGEVKEALPYLEKALAAGVVEAGYTIGMTYLALGNKEQALKHLEDYKRRKPGDESVDTLIRAIHQGTFELKRLKRHP